MSMDCKTIRRDGTNDCPGGICIYHNCAHFDFDRLLDELRRLRAERDDLRMSVIAFGAPWAMKHAQDWGHPKGHLHPIHYDLLAKAGARMDDFTRADVGESG